MALAVTDALRINPDLYFETILKDPQWHKFAYGETQLNHAEDSFSTIGSVDSRERKLQHPNGNPMGRLVAAVRSKSAKRIEKANGANP